MQFQQTLAIIKPTAVKEKHVGAIISHIEEADFHIAAMGMVQLYRAEAEEFYKEHANRPFYGELCDYFCSGPVVFMILEREDAVAAFRKLIGATDPLKAEPGTIRHIFGKSLGENAIHGSDSAESAKREVDFFSAFSMALDHEEWADCEEEGECMDECPCEERGTSENGQCCRKPCREDKSNHC